MSNQTDTLERELARVTAERDEAHQLANDLRKERLGLVCERDRLAAEKEALEKDLADISDYLSTIQGLAPVNGLSQLEALKTLVAEKAALEKRVTELSRDVEELRGEGENSRPTWSELQQSLMLQRRATESNAQRVAALERERDELKAWVSSGVREVNALQGVREAFMRTAKERDALQTQLKEAREQLEDWLIGGECFCSDYTAARGPCSFCKTVGLLKGGAPCATRTK